MNIARLQKSADRMIRGAGGKGFLVRAGVKRDCFCARIEFKPAERGLYLDGAERYFISALKLEVPPDHEQDLLEFKGKALLTSRYRIIVPPLGPRPDGMVVYYDVPVMLVEKF